MKKPEFKKPNIKLNINYEFSKREKVMIYILGMALLVVATLFLVIMPGLNKYQEVSAKRDEAMFKQEEMEMAIAGLDANRKNKTNAETDLTAKKDSYASKMNNEELDNLITNLMVDQGFRPEDLAISKNEIAAVPTFGKNEDGSTPTPSPTPSTEGNTTENKDISGDGTTTTTDNSTTTTGASTITGIYIGSVSMTAVGNLGLFENLLDNVSGRSDIQITNFEVSPAVLRQGAQSALNSLGVSTDTSKQIPNIATGSIGAGVTFNVYMIDKSVPAAEQQNTEQAQ